MTPNKVESTMAPLDEVIAGARDELEWNERDAANEVFPDNVRAYKARNAARLRTILAALESQSRQSGVEAELADRLAPCPFCAGQPTIKDTATDSAGNDADYYFHCDKCNLTGGLFSTPESAALAWNTRHPALRTLPSPAAVRVEPVGDDGEAPLNCTCHPSDFPPKPCPRKHTLSECRAAAGQLTDEQVYDIWISVWDGKYSNERYPTGSHVVRAILEAAGQSSRPAEQGVPVAWISFADQEPPQSAALDDPSVTTPDRVLVTNNINARDRMGRMSHLWLASPHKTDSADSFTGWVAYDEADRCIQNLTHWLPVFKNPIAIPADPGANGLDDHPAPGQAGNTGDLSRSSLVEPVPGDQSGVGGAS